MSEMTETPTTVSDAEDARLAAFDALEAAGAAGQPQWLAQLRKSGIARFSEKGYPTIKDEDWRFTNVSVIADMDFAPSVAAEAVDAGYLDSLEGIEIPFQGLDCHKLVFLNGHFASHLSSVGTQDGVILSTLSEAITAHEDKVSARLGSRSKEDANGFAGLNDAFLSDGLFLHVARNVSLEKPVHVIHVGTVAGSVSHLRHLVEVETSAKATVVETHVSAVEGVYVTNSINEWFVGDNTQAEHVKVQDQSIESYHIARFYSDTGRDSHLAHHSIALGAAISRNDLRTCLAGEGQNCVLNGLYITRGKQVADHHMVVDHASPRCESHEYFNGILDDESKGIFHGRIHVRQIAQKTDAKQTSKNVLLSDSATANAKPQLEIYADDVKCTHGATIGQLDPQSIFYLRARGIGEKRARQMLVHGFAGEIVERIECEPVREELDTLVWDRLEDQSLA